MRSSVDSARFDEKTTTRQSWWREQGVEFKDPSNPTPDPTTEEEMFARLCDLIMLAVA